MSRARPQNPGDPLAASLSRRPAMDDAASMDAAQQSLADALRITFRLLQFVMLLLVVLFLGSGFQTVGESERGVKLVFGRVVEDNVPPGVTWNWPFPVGELVKVKTGQQQVTIDRAFAPTLQVRDLTRPLSEIMPRFFQLNPEQVGSVLTADGAVAHTWWRIVWRRAQPAANARNIYGRDEERLVAAAAQRGVVRAVAEITIDDLLKQGATAQATRAAQPAAAPQAEPGEQPPADAEGAPEGGEPAPTPAPAVAAAPGGGRGDTSLELRVRSIAQESLDAIGAGIVIDQVILAEKSPPGSVMETFANVNNAETQAAKTREDAEKRAREILNGVAGEAHLAILDLIDEYERQYTLGEADAARTTLETLYRIFDGDTVTVENRPVRASGEVTSVIADARQHRTDMESTSRARAASFDAKLPLYLENPQYFVVSEWRPALQDFLSAPGINIMAIPPASENPELWLNRDPEIRNRVERARNEEQTETNLRTLGEQRSRAARERARAEQAERSRQRRSGGGN